MAPERITALLIENSVADAARIRQMLAAVAGLPIDLEHADRLDAGLARYGRGGIDLILLDLSLPDSNGRKTLDQVCAVASHLPIVVLTGPDEALQALDAVQQGAQDYLVKGHFDSASLLRSIRYAIEGKRVEQALKQEQDFVSAVLETVGALVVVLDPQGRIVRFNRACEQTLGYFSHEVEGWPVWDMFLPTEETDAARSAFESVLAGQSPEQHVNSWVAKDGGRHFISWSYTALHDRSGVVQHVICAGLDITRG